jgi:hypothetical protein
MTLILGVASPQHEYSRVLHVADSLTLGVSALIAVALLVVGVTYRRASRARGRPRRLHPRRGTSAVLLGAIAAVLLMLTSASQHRIASLTIVRRAATQRWVGAHRLKDARPRLVVQLDFVPEASSSRSAAPLGP